MTDTFSREDRSRIMSRIRSQGNAATELRFIEIARKYKVVGWRRGSNLPGKPDFIFPRERIAVFVDGDFWHGNPRKFRLPRSNVDYWAKKILANKRRDRRISRLLRSLGWSVLRFWQTSLRDEEAIVARLRRFLAKKCPDCEDTVRGRMPRLKA
jgi:DNA mismatch endonuclease, patch repair protein